MATASIIDPTAAIIIEGRMMLEGIKALAGGVPPELDSRMSKLIWSDINDLHVSFDVRPDTILDEIKNLEAEAH